SIVVIRAPLTEESGVVHERTALPLTWTVQAPQSAAPQPNLVPVSFSSSRMTHSRGVLSSERADTCLPLRTNETIDEFLRAPGSGNLALRPAPMQAGANESRSATKAAYALASP